MTGDSESNTASETTISLVTNRIVNPNDVSLNEAILRYIPARPTATSPDINIIQNGLLNRANANQHLSGSNEDISLQAISREIVSYFTRVNINPEEATNATTRELISTSEQIFTYHVAGLVNVSRNAQLLEANRQNIITNLSNSDNLIRNNPSLLNPTLSNTESIIELKNALFDNGINTMAHLFSGFGIDIINSIITLIQQHPAIAGQALLLVLHQVYIYLTHYTLITVRRPFSISNYFRTVKNRILNLLLNILRFYKRKENHEISQSISSQFVNNISNITNNTIEALRNITNRAILNPATRAVAAINLNNSIASFLPIFSFFRNHWKKLIILFGGIITGTVMLRRYLFPRIGSNNTLPRLSNPTSGGLNDNENTAEALQKLKDSLIGVSEASRKYFKPLIRALFKNIK